MVALIAALSPVALQLFHEWAQDNPTASDDEAKSELERLAASDADAKAEYDATKADMASAKERLKDGTR